MSTPLPDPFATLARIADDLCDAVVAKQHARVAVLRRDLDIGFAALLDCEQDETARLAFLDGYRKLQASLDELERHAA